MPTASEAALLSAIGPEPWVYALARHIKRGAAPLAPRRHLLTKTMGNGLAASVGYPGASVPMTFLAVIPLEAPCYAVRLGFANPYNLAMTISKASVYPSDSYSVLPAAGFLDPNGSTQRFPVPTGGAAGVPMYFDNAGAFNTVLNTAGTTRGFTLPAVTANTGNVAAAYTIQWTDLMPCTSLPRADGTNFPVLFVYVTISSADMARVNALSVPTYNGDDKASRGRPYWLGQAWTTGTDYADNPTGTGFKAFPNTPLVAVQYLTANPGIQTVVCGDSLSCAPTDDGFSSPLMRAGRDLSSPDRPVEYASMAWGGTTSPVYDVMLSNNAAALRPSIVAHQPLSRNDGSLAANMQMLLAKSSLLVDAHTAAYGTRHLWNIAGLEPSFDGQPTYQAAFLDMRARLLAIGARTDVPVIDAVSVVGNIAGGAPWDYLIGLSNDNTHPNYSGVELIVPQATAALQQLIGI